jgi:hypothetical protein
MASEVLNSACGGAALRIAPNSEIADVVEALDNPVALYPKLLPYSRLVAVFEFNSVYDSCVASRDIDLVNWNGLIRVTIASDG